MKSILLALALTLATTSVSAAELDRNQYIAACNAGAPKDAKVEVAAAVCNCSAQLVSYALTDKQDLYYNFTIDTANPMGQGAIDHCVKILNDMPWEFMRQFGTLRAG